MQEASLREGMKHVDRHHMTPSFLVQWWLTRAILLCSLYYMIRFMHGSLAIPQWPFVSGAPLLASNSGFMEYVLSLLSRRKSKEVERALLASMYADRCSASVLSHLGHKQQQ